MFLLKMYSTTIMTKNYVKLLQRKRKLPNNLNKVGTVWKRVGNIIRILFYLNFIEKNFIYSHADEEYAMKNHWSIITWCPAETR